MAEPTRKPVRKPAKTAIKAPVAPASESATPPIPVVAAAFVEAPAAALPEIHEPTGVQPAVREADAPALPPTAAAPVAPAASAAKEVTMDTIDTAQSTVDTAKSNFETATNKAEGLFNEAGDRAKGAMEKGQKMMEDAADFGRGNLEALVESSRIAARGFESLSHDSVAYAKKSFEEATAAAKQLASVKSPTEFMKLHADYARNAFDALVAESSARAEAVLKLAGEVAQPISNRVALAAEKMKVAA